MLLYLDFNGSNLTERLCPAFRSGHRTLLVSSGHPFSTAQSSGGVRFPVCLWKSRSDPAMLPVSRGGLKPTSVSLRHGTLGPEHGGCQDTEMTPWPKPRARCLLSFLKRIGRAKAGPSPSHMLSQETPDLGFLN